jgi:hypothetical protein
MVQLDCNKCCAKAEHTCICENKEEIKVVVEENKETRGRKKVILTEEQKKVKKDIKLNKRKEWYAKNKDKAKEYLKKWNTNNNNKNKDKLKEKVDCLVCDCKVTRYHMSRHVKTKLHMKLIKKEDKKQIECNDKIDNILDPDLTETSSLEEKMNDKVKDEINLNSINEKTI